MKRFILLLVVLAGGLAWAAFAIPNNAATVNGATISQSQLSSDLSAIAHSREYQCFLNAQAYVGSGGTGTLPQLDGAGQSLSNAAHPTATSAFTSEYLGTEIGHQIIFNQAAKRHLHVTQSEISSATAQLSAQISQTMAQVAQAQVQDNAITCGPGPTLTGKEVLATLPPSFVNALATYDATVGALEGSLSKDNTTAGLTRYYKANRSVFDTACVTLAQYSSQSDAAAAAAKVAAGTPFAQVAAAQSGGGPQGCGVLYGLAVQFPSGTNLPSQKTGAVSAPIPLGSGNYLLVQITSRTPTSFAKAKPEVEAAAAQSAANETRALLDATELHAAISVNPKYGSWEPANARVVIPSPPPVADTLNASANTPTPAVPTSGKSG